MTTRAQTIERLNQVVRVLDELPPEKKFDLGFWMRCGTVGCAIGWAGRDEWFNRRGFSMRPVPYQRKYAPHYRGWEGYMAVWVFFDLSGYDTEFLFSPRRYKRGNRRDVMQRIRAFVRKLEAEDK